VILTLKSGTINYPRAYRKKQRHREVKRVVQDFTAIGTDLESQPGQPKSEALVLLNSSRLVNREGNERGGCRRGLRMEDGLAGGSGQLSEMGVHPRGLWVWGRGWCGL
jgi:hypothetical protein